MGFMGLSHWCDSDNAADLRAFLLYNMAETLKKELTEKANEYNTPGFINVALVLEDKTIFGKIDKNYRSNFYEVTHETIKMLKEAIASDDWDASDKKSMKRMKKNLETWIKGVENE
jgi:hypothetical protein